MSAKSNALLCFSEINIVWINEHKVVGYWVNDYPYPNAYCRHDLVSAYCEELIILN